MKCDGPDRCYKGILRKRGASPRAIFPDWEDGVMQSPALTYAIKFVGDMEAAVEFYRDVLGLPLKFQSPGWSSFITGDVTLALHPASEKNPAGAVELGFGVRD